MHYTLSQRKRCKNYVNLDLVVQEVMMFKQWFVSMILIFYEMEKSDAMD